MHSILSFCQGLPERSFATGECLLVDGQPADALYILIEGELEVWKGDYLIRSVSEPGAIFGELSVLLGTCPTATVKAGAPSRAYVVEDAESFLQSHQDVTHQVARLLAQRLNSITTYLVDLKRQFEDQEDHLGMVDEVLETLVHQQDEALDPGSDRDPDTSI